MTAAAARPRPSSRPLVRMDGVTCAYGSTVALRDVDLTLDERELVGVVGPSGSGKTTLLRTLAQRIQPVRGRLERRPDLRVGYVPQTETVDWTFPVTVRQVVLMGRLSRRLPWASRPERAEADRVLERLGVGGVADRHISELSGGQQQRVFLARALLSRPQLLLADEPTAGVDVRTRHEVLHLLCDLHRDGLSIVLTTHDLNGIAAHLPRLICVQGGIVADGPPLEVLTPATLETTFGAPMDVLDHMGLPLVVDRQMLSAAPGAVTAPPVSVQVEAAQRLAL
ncbi:MAG: metal ABC transporter ATP-binding protein [Acidimicrobiia bacterium]|nr:metal ABC transporter ATP-binding protein [Acidimicrobiia bacterium]